jgi:hypothetical protein
MWTLELLPQLTGKNRLRTPSSLQDFLACLKEIKFLFELKEIAIVKQRVMNDIGLEYKAHSFQLTRVKRSFKDTSLE